MIDLPLNPLPSDASPAWVDVWLSVCRLKDGASAAVVHAYEAGMNPGEFCGIQLAGDAGYPDPKFPIISFGAHHNGPCRRFAPHGEVAPLSGEVSK